ncbi:HAD family phosphatase [Caproiciproducens sp. NJN-50]|uniref:Cof-type HAD-IIB family hydrolase n=1 Tax=Acutalibacteraceae TaxID=3082771 RepID=UPI000FFE214B|nr:MULTISPECIES: Cof-type HAD-IIB family hydrolase [Acutalibacteraceae]QAT50195.1 HAD family phosphatase [Caproiciproducens sp. NJN-50]
MGKGSAMRFQLIAFDLDGTVLRDDKTISPRTLGSLKAAASLGIRVVPATGRVAKMVPDELLQLPGTRYVLTSNGASVVDLKNRSVVYSRPMALDASLRIVRFFASGGFFVEAYCGGVSYADAAALPALRGAGLPDRFFRYIDASQTFVGSLPDFLERKGAPLEKVNVPYVPALEKERLAREVLAMGPYSVTSSGSVNLEINDAEASKGDGLLHLCHILGIEPGRVAAFGDGDNDRSMLRFAGLGIAMGNAEPGLFRQADYVTSTNEEDGVAQAIEKLILSPER